MGRAILGQNVRSTGKMHSGHQKTPNTPKRATSRRRFVCSIGLPMVSDFASGALTLLCDQNGARGAIFRETPGGLQLELASAGLDQQFLDHAKAMWLPSGERSTNGSLHSFRIPGGVVYLDQSDEKRCPPKIREHLLMAISEALCDSRAGPVPSLSEDDVQRLRLQSQLRSPPASARPTGRCTASESLAASCTLTSLMKSDARQRSASIC